MTFETYSSKFFENKIIIMTHIETKRDFNEIFSLKRKIKQTWHPVELNYDQREHQLLVDHRDSVDRIVEMVMG